MSKSGEYLKGTKRLQIINKWLRGIEDPFYEVYPTRKDGKYILKKRKEPLEVSDDEDADNELLDIMSERGQPVLQGGEPSADMNMENNTPKNVNLENSNSL